MELTDSLERCVDVIVERVGRDVRVGTPLGLGKPNHLLNALYARAKADTSLKLTVFTALTLSVPRAKSDLEKRLLEPFVARVFAGYPELDIERDRERGALPDNVRVEEFYFSPGKYMASPAVQRDHICTNFTYVARDLLDRGVNTLLQQVSVISEAGEMRLSLSGNADVTPDLVHALQGREDVCMAVQTNAQLPFMFGDAEISPDACDVVVHAPALDYPPFGMPKQPVPDADMLIGLYASSLVRDGGDLQIGIGSLGDAVAYGLTLRQQDNPAYRRALESLGVEESAADAIDAIGGRERFERGLFAATEMLVDGYQALWEAGVLKRDVYDDARLQALLNDGSIDERVTPETLRTLLFSGAIPARLDAAAVEWLCRFGVLRDEVRFDAGELVLGEVRTAADLDDPECFAAVTTGMLGSKLRGGAVIHAGFFLGPNSFYAWLRELPESERARIQMRSVRRINHLYGNEALYRLQRVHARFINTGMMATLMGAVVSDGLEDGRVVSGVGGQHDFVDMAHALDDGRSVLLVRATRTSGGEVKSNILPSYGHVTVPRHQRDVLVTEYGVAMLRGKTDAEIAAAMIQVADSRFQPQLIEEAKKRGLLAPSWTLEARYSDNLPERYEATLAQLRKQGLFSRYPFGSDFDEVEQVLLDALLRLKRSAEKLEDAIDSLAPGVLGGPSTDALAPYLQRMGLAEPSTFRDRLTQKALVLALRAELSERD